MRFSARTMYRQIADHLRHKIDYRSWTKRLERRTYLINQHPAHPSAQYRPEHHDPGRRWRCHAATASFAQVRSLFGVCKASPNTIRDAIQLLTEPFLVPTNTNAR